MFGSAFYFNEWCALIFHFVEIHRIQLFTHVGMFAQRIGNPGNINICKQIKIILTSSDQVEDSLIATTILYLAPHFDHDEVSVAHEDPVGVDRPLIFHSKLAVCDLQQVCFFVRLIEPIEISAGVLFDPHRIEMFGERLRQDGFTRAFRTDHTHFTDVGGIWHRRAKLTIFQVLKASKVKRRQAIRHLGVGFSSALVGASWLSSCKKDDPGPEVQYDGNVIVIGAGPAGLYAADILMTKGLNVTVLEASKQVGGRVASLRNQLELPYQSIADFPVELGAEYWQGSDSLLGKIIENLRLDTVNLGVDTRRYILGTEVKSAADWAGNGDFEAVKAFVDGLKTYSGPTTSIKDAAGGLSENASALLNSWAANFYGSSSDRVGVKGISEQLKLVTHDTDYYTLKNQTLQSLVISRFVNVYDHVTFESPVKSINYSSDPITLTMEDGTEMTANKVIITVPITILKNGITFTPALPSEKTAALNKIGMDPSMRVVLDFKKNFWGTDSSFLWGGKIGPQYFNAGMSRSESPQTMTVTINGPRAQELSDLNDNEKLVDAVLEELDTMYDGQASQFIRTGLPPDDDGKRIYFIKDWTKEKYIGGGISYPLVNTTLDDRTALISPVGDKLFIAGEATDISGEAGTINGALASAERVAEDVVQSIKKVS